MGEKKDYYQGLIEYRFPPVPHICKVSDLIKALQGFKPDMPVVAYDDRLYNFVRRLWVHEGVDVAMGSEWLDDQTVLVIE